jgi:hypothetical protein
MAECNWHFITDAYDGPHKAVDISVEPRGLLVTGINVDATKFSLRTQGGRIILERTPDPHYSQPREAPPDVDRPTSPAA